MSMRKKTAGLVVWLITFVMICGLLPAPVSAAGSVAWDGKTIDVSWYNNHDSEFYISTPAQLMGLAAIVNGIYNSGITGVLGDKSVIVDNIVTSDDNGAGGQNKSTSAYHFGTDNFNGKAVYLTADLDMGGIYNTAAGTWSGPNFMPIGGQYLMTKNDPATKLSSSFCGTFDGQGHTIYNIYCERHCSTGNYGDGQSVGLIGRLGLHDNDPVGSRPVNPAVRNVAVTGYIFANRSVGGIVGKMGKTSYNNGDGSTGGIIENCANFAAVGNTDAKGCGGIVGSGWNGGVVRNCYNAGPVSTTYVCPTGGISGSNEIKLENCYSTGKISAIKDSYAMGLGTNNGGAPYEMAVANCYYLIGSAPGGGYYSSGNVYDDGALTAAEMKADGFVKRLDDAFIKDVKGINNGFPILRWQENVKGPVISSLSDVSATAWYYEAVHYVMNKGLFDVTGGAFDPEQPMTRAMLVTAFYRLEGSPPVTVNYGFADIPANAGYKNAVQWAYDKGIVQGLNPSAFNPGGSITREQIAVMFYQYAVYKGADVSAAGGLAAFPDNGQVAAWARDAMTWAVAKKLINGMGDGTVNPQGTATRAQVAQILFNEAAQ